MINIYHWPDVKGLIKMFIKHVVNNLLMNSVMADLHGTILSHATSLRHAYDTYRIV